MHLEFFSYNNGIIDITLLPELNSHILRTSICRNPDRATSFLAKLELANHVNKFHIHSKETDYTACMMLFNILDFYIGEKLLDKLIALINELKLDLNYDSTELREKIIINYMFNIVYSCSEFNLDIGVPLLIFETKIGKSIISLLFVDILEDDYSKASENKKCSEIIEEKFTKQILTDVNDFIFNEAAEYTIGSLIYKI